MENQVEQPAPADSADPMDALMDRMMGSETQEEVPQDAQTQSEEQPQEQPQEESQPETPSDSEDDFEYEGLKLRLPKDVAGKLKSAVEGYRDYTQKTQAVAERERMVALHQQQQQLEGEFQQSVQQEQIQLYQLEAAIKQYEQVNWPSLDVETYIKTKHQLDSLKEQRDQVKQGIDGKRQEFVQKSQETLKQALQKANEVLTRAIPKWGPEVQKQLMSYGQSEGYTDVELGSIRDPRIIKTLWKAQQWDNLQSSKSLAQKRAKGVPPVVKPGATKPAPSQAVQLADTVKQLHQAKDPNRKKELFDKSLDLKLSRMLG